MQIHFSLLCLQFTRENQPIPISHNGCPQLSASYDQNTLWIYSPPSSNRGYISL